MRRHTPQILLLAAVALGMTFVAAESVARLLGMQWSAMMLLGPETCTEWHPDLGLQFRPHCSGILGDTPFTTNAARLRGPELRDDGAVRVLAIGDSCTWGWRVAEEESYPSRLEDLLGRQRTEVVNGGFPGYTSHQGVAFLRERGRELRPRVVIAGYGFNDIDARGDIAAQLAAARRLGRVLAADHWLLARSRVYQWVRFHLAAPNAPGQAPRVSAAAYAENLRTIVTLAREYGAAPILLDLWAPGSRADSADAPARIAHELNVPVVVYDGPRIDVVHPTVDGYAHLAALLLEPVRKTL